MNMVVSGVAGSRPARGVSITDGPRKRTDQGRRLPAIRGSPALHSFLSVTGLSANADLTSPRTRRVVRGMIHYVAEHARLNLHEAGTFRLSRLRKGPGVRFSDSIFGKLLEPINRRQFQAV